MSGLGLRVFLVVWGCHYAYCQVAGVNGRGSGLSIGIEALSPQRFGVSGAVISSDYEQKAE